MTDPTIDLDRLITLDWATFRAQLVAAAVLVIAGILAMTVMAARAAGTTGIFWFGLGLVTLLAGIFMSNACLGRWERIVALRTAKRSPDVVAFDRSGEFVSRLYGDVIGEH